jgi:D-alanyl-lipoteichoic acid acyltransferase DltB (MBOAT superfamily)
MLLKSKPEAASSRRRLLIFGISANILFLCWYKYAAFFVQIFNHLAGTKIHEPRLAFPLGISFFTIYQIMFLVDCYEELVEGHSWLDHFTFASFFPYVTMGPIVRWKQIAPQLNQPNAYQPNADNIAKGLYIFVVGLFKKAVLADSFFRWADAGFNYNHTLSLVGSWIAALAFTFELYFDFSGYTDMAVGAALILNINVPQNFNAPFRAQSIIDFWRRWHITLTNFITTYLYTPMLRSFEQVTLAKSLLATFIAMLIAGFWHGANWTFLIFGALHGAALALNQFWRKMKWPMPAALGWLLTFSFVVVSLVFFRSSTTTQAVQIVRSMFSLRGGLLDYSPWSGIEHVDTGVGVCWMLFGIAILVRAPSSMEMERTFKPSWATVAIVLALAIVAVAYANGVVSRSFVYRDF